MMPDKPELKRHLSKEEKKQYLLKKFVEVKPPSLDDIKKYGVFWRPAVKDTEKWELVTVCDTLEQAEAEVLWRYEFHKTNNTDKVIDNDKRFATFKDETLNVDEQGKTIEPDASDLGDRRTMNLTDSGNLMGNIIDSSLTSKSGFKGLGYYNSLELEYRGYYKIDEFYDVAE